MTNSGLVPFEATAASKPYTFPLCVDLDGTLIRTDMLFESLALCLRRQPWLIVLLPFWLLRGRAYLKQQIFARFPVDPAHLPYQADFLDYLRAEKKNGRQLHLVSASDSHAVRAVAEHLKIFDSATGSDGHQNLKGAKKQQHLIERFPDGFSYAGDSSADTKVWQAAQTALPVNASKSTEKKAGLITHIEGRFGGRPSLVSALATSMRFHHWIKNLLIFTPLILGYEFLNPQSVFLSLAGFIIFGVVASATYIFNDLLDLEADRQHPKKRFRPLASGDLPILYGFFVPPILYGIGLYVAYVLSPPFAIAILGYLTLTTVYSFWLKRVAIVDIIALAGLFTIRILMGVLLLQQEVSHWLLMFSIAIFGSLSLIKRYVELVKTKPAGEKGLAGRAYIAGDETFILPLGVGTSIMSVLVLVLYILNDQMPAEIYSHPQWLWALPVVIYFWQAQLWLQTIRGHMNDDPIVFAVKDKATWLATLVSLIFVFMAL